MASMLRFRRFLALTLGTLAITACASGGSSTETSGSPSAPTLAGSTWRLVEFQSSDDAIGIVRPRPSAMYSMTLGDDGSASFRLDCNRGSGTWQAEFTSSVSGSFVLSPLAMTRAACPEPSLDQQVGRHAEYIRSFVLREGRLHLSLMADGGIYVWEPMESAR
jgi:heat shock protein HslJ